MKSKLSEGNNYLGGKTRLNKFYGRLTRWNDKPYDRSRLVKGNFVNRLERLLPLKPFSFKNLKVIP